jgi:hypothetical protein
LADVAKVAPGCLNFRLISQGEAEDLLHMKVHALAPVYPYLALVDIRYEGEVAGVDWGR